MSGAKEGHVVGATTDPAVVRVAYTRNEELELLVLASAGHRLTLLSTNSSSGFPGLYGSFHKDVLNFLNL